jgi:2-(1,2-epoxy-1,2-dihydrophenyl)acetyl-CoA isomerase
VITTASRDGIPIVRLDRPAERNAMLPAMLQTLIEALTQAATQHKPVILTGAGTAFCVGADLNWLASFVDPAQGVTELVSVHHRAILTMVDLSVPVIAAVNGAAAGGGLSLALAADYSLAAETASFTAAYFRLGLTPDGGSTVLLQRAIGAARTRELLLTNLRLDATTAREWGLINDVVPTHALMDRAVSFAKSLAPVPSETLVQTRRLLDDGVLRHRLQLEADAICTAARGEFFRDAIARFREAHSRA